MRCLPTVLQETHSADSLLLQLHLPANLLQFQGHFPGFAITPGVSQVDWAVQLARNYLPVHGSYSGLSGLKFMRVMRPNMQVTLQLRWQPPALLFCYQHQGQVCSEGKVQFAGLPA